jgi:hypothetical protein
VKGKAKRNDKTPLNGNHHLSTIRCVCPAVQEERFTQGVALGYDEAPLQGADIHHPIGMLCLERLLDRFEQTKKNGGIAIAGMDAGAPRDPLAINESGQDERPGYRVEAGAYRDVTSDG